MSFGSSKTAQNRDSSAEKPLIISISGDLGSGKSLLANALVTRWEADRYSTGMVQRRLADRMGITTLELNRRAETDPTIDEQIDHVFRNLAKTPKNLVVDSRMAFHFLPMSFRIKLEVHPKVAATRIQNDTSRVGEGNYDSLEAIEAAILARKASERERFKRYYNADIEDHAGYDLVISTTDCPPDDVAKIANESIALWRRGERAEKFWLSPRHIYSATDPATLDPIVVERDKVSWPHTGGWPDAAITGVKQGQAYVISKGHEWVSAGLKSTKTLVPLLVTNENLPMPTSDQIEKWQKHHDFKYMA